MPGLLISMESNGGMSAVNGNSKQAASTADARNIGKVKSHALTNGDTPIPGLGPYPTPNGVSPSSPGPAAMAPSTFLDLPPELRHIDAGMSLGTLIERVGELCHRGVEDLILSLEKKPVPMLNGNGPYGGNKPDVNQIKKKEIMDFVHLQRSKFIKLMVLVQWSGQAAKQMDQMIDLKAWAHDLDICYEDAANNIAMLKRNLKEFKLRSPDMETALAVLSTGKVPWMADIGFLPSPPLKAKRMLKVLSNLDTMLNIRLVIHENLIPQLRNYRIANGRATFSFPSEFELDVYITGEDPSLPFYFLDVRFLFHPAPQIADGFLRNEIEFKLNAILAENGLRGACDFIHSFILTHKISVLKRQAVELSRANWASSLHIEQVHRVLVVQYWTESPQSKSWIEIGIESGKRKGARFASDNAITSLIKVRWMRNGKAASDVVIPIDLKELSLEQLLKRTVALHVGHILQSTHTQLESIKAALPANTRETMSLKLTASETEPADCALVAQIGTHPAVTLSIDGVTGRPVLSPGSPTSIRAQLDLEHQRNQATDAHLTLTRYLTFEIHERISRQAERLGWTVMRNINIKGDDLKARMGVEVLRHGFLRAKGWKTTNWFIVYSVNLSGESWWAAEVIYESDAYRLSDCRPLPTRTNSHRQPPLSPESFMQIQHFAARAISIWEANKTLVRLNIPSAIRHVEYSQEDRSSNETVKQSTPKTLPALCVRFTSLLKDFTGKNQFAADLLQISYIGFDTDVGTVKLLAKGMMRKPGRLKEILQRTRDDDVAFNASGSFSLVLKTGLGRSCVDRLVAQLRTIGRLCNFADVLKQRGLECKDISLSRVVFTYAEGLEVELRFTGSDTTPIKLAIPSDNPHRRIASLLEAIVNSGSDGFRNFTAALQFTLPLLTAFDTIENRHLSSTPNLPVMHSRNVDHFRLAYSNPPCAFEFKLKQTRDVLEWVIQEMISTPARDERSKTYPTINEKLKEVFKSVGNGWTGKNSMIVADVKAIGEPLLRLDDVIKGCIKTESMSPRTGAQDGPDVVVLD